jgi:hypothetical protein
VAEHILVALEMGENINSAGSLTARGAR